MISEKSYAQLEGFTRHKKANKIVLILSKFVDLSKCFVLDIGVGSGHIAQDISKKSKSLVGVDLHDERTVKSGYSFKKVSDEKLPFVDNVFDVVISNQIIEHVPNQNLHIKEIHRVLKKNGVVYLATPNKYWITDPHSKLPFISWFPRKISSFYLKLLKNRKWDIYPLSYNQIKKLIKNKFVSSNMTLKIIKNPKKYGLDVFFGLQLIFKLLPFWILKLFKGIVPSYILILKKK